MAKRGILRPVAILALLSGCRPQPAPPPPPTVADLQFPVVVDFDSASLREFPTADSLNTMSVGWLNAVEAPPSLIDSSFRIYVLEKLGSTHSTLWLMINPTGSTPVKFELTRAPKSGVEAAREIFRAQLDSQTWRRDLEEKRRALATEQTLAGMLAIVWSEAK